MIERRKHNEGDAAGAEDSRVIAAAAVGLVLVGVLLTLFEFIFVRREFEQSAETLIRITGIHSAAAVVFHDAAAAGETLAALAELPNVEAVAIFTENGERLAASSRAGEPPLASADAAGELYDWMDMTTAVSIVADDKPVGTIAARFELAEPYGRVAAFSGMYLLSGLCVFAVGLPLWRRLRSQVERARARLTRLAHYDPITGELNRNAFNRDLRISLESCAPDQRVGLVILDIDDFKDVNDRFGHKTGDDLLKQFAQRLARGVRGSDRVYRLGGDEFAVLLQPLSDPTEAETIAERLFLAFASPIALRGHRLQASFSAGIGIFPDDASDMETLVANADTAMYDVKHRNKNTFRRFAPHMTESTLRRLRLQEDLREALSSEGQLSLLYQPQMDADGTTITGMETLLRWRHPELGAISPAEFIPLAEDCGLVVPLGLWVLRMACLQTARWRAAGHTSLRVSVNLSVRQIQDRSLLGSIDRVLEETGLPPQGLELEITESLLLEDADTNMSLMQALRDRGIELAIDDFGKGYSSMSYLHRLPVNRLKIDMCFVHDIPGGGEAITTAIIAMAHSLGLTAIAEGVETKEQLDFLREAGCDGLQGFLLAPPLPAAEAGALLDERALRAMQREASASLRPIRSLRVVAA